jgi:hypothetical protein
MLDIFKETDQNFDSPVVTIDGKLLDINSKLFFPIQNISYFTMLDLSELSKFSKKHPILYGFFALIGGGIVLCALPALWYCITHFKMAQIGTYCVVYAVICLGYGLLHWINKKNPLYGLQLHSNGGERIITTSKNKQCVEAAMHKLMSVTRGEDTSTTVLHFSDNSVNVGGHVINSRIKTAVG